jgi:hypothetical protein
MIEAFAPYVISAMWFTACGVALLPLSRLYVSSLVVVGRLRFLWRVLAGSALWLLFSAIGLLPLFCGAVFGARNRTERREWPVFIWFLCCYVVSLVPVYKKIKGELPGFRLPDFSGMKATNGLSP